MLVLRRITPLNITQRRIGLNNPHVAEVFERPHVLLLLPRATEAVYGGGSTVLALEPPTAEGECAEGLGYVVEEFFGTG